MRVNIFDYDIIKNVEQHCDKHVIKLIIEAVQIICTVGWLNGIEMFYRKTHEWHPLIKWAGECSGNLQFVRNYAMQLDIEYRYRWNHNYNHLSYYKLITNHCSYSELLGKLEHATVNFDTFPKLKGYEHLELTESFKHNFVDTKQHIAKWTKRDIPNWFIKG